MLTVHFLGTGAAVPGSGRDNTSLALDDGQDVTLIDASGSPLKRLIEAGIDPGRLSRVIITHEHLDHTFAYVALLQSLWLSGRKAPLDVYAQPPTWRVLDGLAALYRVDRWPDAFAVRRHEIEPNERPFVETPGVQLCAGRGQHAVPSIGVRATLPSGTCLVYTSDTSPAESVGRLADHANVLIHEATFLPGNEAQANRLGHSTSRQAGEVAASAQAERLVLIHYTPVEPGDLDLLREGAEAAFRRPVNVPTDGDTLELA